MKRALAFPLAAVAVCVATACGADALVESPTTPAPGTQLVTKAPISPPNTVPIDYKEIPTKPDLAQKLGWSLGP